LSVLHVSNSNAQEYNLGGLSAFVIDYKAFER
jgi:hypothetical protein